MKNRRMKPWRLKTTRRENDAIKDLLVSIRESYSSIEETPFYNDVYLFAQELPRRVRAFFNDFKFNEELAPVCLIEGYEIDRDKIGSTPSHWDLDEDADRTFEEQALLVLYGSLLGDIMGWATQQGGHHIHDVLPIEGLSHEQIATGSEQTIYWHTEDAFHQYRPDYVGLLCLRNPDQVATTFSYLEKNRLKEEQIKRLLEPRYLILPDESHMQKNMATHVSERSKEFLGMHLFEKIQRALESPPKQPVLFGHAKSPYMRLDPYYMDFSGLDEASQKAVDALIDALEGNLSEVILQPGDTMFIDNYRAVHGRKSFKAKFDGTDRWLKRVCITRDIRRSRESRQSSLTRIIF